MSLAAFNELLSNMFGKIHHENKYVYIFVDLNVNTMPNIKDNVNIQDFNNIFGSNYCLPLITKPTVVKNIIDNIDSDVPIKTNNCNSRILEVSFSDHYAIFPIL